VSAIVIYVGLLIARITAFVGVMPLFGARAPRTVRLGLALALVAFYLGNVSPGWSPELARKPADVHPVRMALAMAREALIGLAMGLAFGLFLLPARVAGEFITHQIGLNITPENSATSTESGSVISNTFEIVTGLVFLVADGHHVVLGVLHSSFSSLPLGGAAVPQIGPMVGGLQTAYEMGLLLAGPLALCLLLLAVTLAIMARTAPQLNVYSVGFSLQVLVLLFGGVFLIPEFVFTIHAIVDRTGAALTQAAGG
jgi:flagellar biosynthetic protein FliR